MKENAFRFLFVFLLFAMCSGVVNAQTTVSGTVVDARDSEPIIGAAVVVSGSSQGVVTDIDGKFELTVQASNPTIVIKFLGYKDVQKKISGSGFQNLREIRMEEDAYALADVTITQSVAIERKTPVALSTVTPLFIEDRLGAQEFPEILKSTPSTYVIRDGGGFGDAKTYIRGFKSENVAVMVNGVPVNDMEWGGVYWSNWAGLSDVARSVQVQRGLGASKVSAPTVGGSINIITRTIDAKKGGFVSYRLGDGPGNKIVFSVSTGLMDNGWAVTMLGGKQWGNEYAQGTEYESYNYFLSIAKRFNDKHQLTLMGTGAPQEHYQRSAYDGLTVKGWQEVEKYTKPGEQYRYNATYGFDKNGQRRTSAKNKYHKPQISLNHMWQIDNTSSLSTAVYLSLGDGWGYSGQGTSAYSSAWYGSTNGTLNTQFRKPDGTFAYDEIQELNENSVNGSQMVMSVSKNLHKWWGLLSTYTKQLNENVEVFGGIDGRYYVGTHTNEIIDLYNGEYYIDRNRNNVRAENNKAALDPGFKTEKLTVGDVVNRDYDGHVLQGGLFGQVEYNTDQLSSFVSGSLNSTSQWRYDRFYYDKEHAKSETVSKIGFTIKGGANYNLNEQHNVFANIGYISRYPFFSGGAFLNSTYSNVVNKDAVNEKIFSVEVGYGFKSDFFDAKLNGYHTNWNDKTMARSQDFEDKNGNPDRAMINMQGVNATHQGLELEITARPFVWLDVTGMLSLGNWRWTNNPIGYYYNSMGEPIDKNYEPVAEIGGANHATSELQLDGIKVGGSAQTSAALDFKFKPTKDINVGIAWNYFGRNYADWSFSTNDMIVGGEKVFNQPWEIPSYNVFDLYANYSFKMGSLPAKIAGNITNLFDQEYISSAYDGSSNEWDTAYRVFYGFGRRMSVSLRVSF